MGWGQGLWAPGQALVKLSLSVQQASLRLAGPVSVRRAGAHPIWPTPTVLQAESRQIPANGLKPWLGWLSKAPEEAEGSLQRGSVTCSTALAEDTGQLQRQIQEVGGEVCGSPGERLGDGSIWLGWGWSPKHGGSGSGVPCPTVILCSPWADVLP